MNAIPQCIPEHFQRCRTQEMLPFGRNPERPDYPCGTGDLPIWVTSMLGQPVQVWCPLAQHPLVERMAQRTLAFADGALDLVLPNSAENDLLTFVSQLGLRHVAEVFLLFNGRKTTLDLRQPISITGQRRAR